MPVARPFSKNGVVRPFDRHADGTVIGEGAAAVILKRLDDAKQDGDRIYAVIKGVGTSTGGLVESQVPDKRAYGLSIELASQDAGTAPESVSYLETSGSGLAMEDELEANALGAFFGSRQTQNPCYIGSAKADIGHAGAAAGLASLIKATLCLQQQVLPPLRNLQVTRYDWVRGKRSFIAPEAAQFWLRNRAEGPRRALVSGLGVDGTCSHVLLESMEDLAPTLRIQSCTLLAPAASIGLFESHYYPYLISQPDAFGIEKMHLFNLNDRLERDDNVGKIYRKSLLYLVSHAFEEELPEAILGMQNYVDQLLEKPKMARVRDRFHVHYSDGTPSIISESISHGGFDNDVATMNSLLRTILGAEPSSGNLFSKEILDY